MQYPGSLCHRAGLDAHRNNSRIAGGNATPTRRRARQFACSRNPIEETPSLNFSGCQRERSSWLSLATRSNASLALLMRY
jgi:hypothetical protein